MLRKTASLIFATIIAISGNYACAQVPAANGPATASFLIRFNNPPGQAQADLVSARGGRVTRQFKVVPAFAAQLPPQAVAALRNAPGVVDIEPDLEVMAHDYSQTWGVVRIDAPSVHSGTWVGEGEVERPIVGRSIRIAVVDTGIDYTHPDLAPNFRGGYDFVNNDNDPMDDQWHGTHVAGTVAAAKNGFGVVGVAPEVELYGLKVLAANGSGSFSSVIAALDWAIQNKIQVVNLSLGSSGDPGKTVRQAFTNAYQAGLVIVASAGNSGSGADTVGFPAKYDSVIAVGSTTSNDVRSSFSSTGPAVELTAPGTAIYSTDLGGGYYTASGTSMAAPHVAGLAALVLDSGIGDLNGNGLVNDEVRLVMQSTATDLGDEGRDDWYGFGLVNAASAVWLASGSEAEGPSEPPVDEPVILFDAPSNLLGSSQSTLVTLTWQDNSNIEDGFEYQFGTGKGNSIRWATPVAVAADSTSASFTLAPDSYHFRVRAIAAGLTTDWSNRISLNVTDSSSGGGKGGGKKK